MASLVLGATTFSNKQKKLANRAAEERRQGLDAAKTQMKPYQEYGATAMERQNRLFADPSYLQETGGYKFVQEQGLKGTTAARSRSSIFSGETLKALTEYSAGLASQEYDKEWNRFQKGIDVGMGASGMIAEIEAGKGEATARASDQMAAYWSGYEGTMRQFDSAWNSAAASKFTGPMGMGK